MRIPIRNTGKNPFTLFVEVRCDQFEVPVGGDAIVHLADGYPHSIDVDGDLITVWDEEGSASVEIIFQSDKRVDDALRFAQIWLHRLGAEVDACLLGEIVERLETKIGYFAARDQVFRAFHLGFSHQDMPSSADESVVACWRVGTTAARLNEQSHNGLFSSELLAAPFNTSAVRKAFERALSDGSQSS